MCHTAGWVAAGKGPRTPHRGHCWTTHRPADPPPTHRHTCTHTQAHTLLRTTSSVCTKTQREFTVLLWRNTTGNETLPRTTKLWCTRRNRGPKGAWRTSTAFFETVSMTCASTCKTPLAHITVIKTAQHLDLRCVLLYRIPAPLVPGIPTKTRLESSIKKFKPYVIYNWCFRAHVIRVPGGPLAGS